MGSVREVISRTLKVIEAGILEVRRKEILIRDLPPSRQRSSPALPGVDAGAFFPGSRRRAGSI